MIDIWHWHSVPSVHCTNNFLRAIISYCGLNLQDDMEEDGLPREVDPMVTDTTELKV